MMEKATFDDLIRLKLRKDEQKEKPVEILVESLGKNLVFTSPTRDQQLDFIGEVRKAGDINNSYAAYRKLVYDCCPMLHDTKLHEKLGIVDPYDSVDVLFSPVEVMEIGDDIADAFMSAAKDIKNS